MDRHTSYFFSHDYNARNNPKILMLRAHFGAEGYGVFWMLVETMAERSDGMIDINHLAGLSIGFGITIETLTKIVSYATELNLFQQDGQFITTKRVLEHKEQRKKIRDGAKKGAQKRWGKLGDNDNNNPPPNAPGNAQGIPPVTDGQSKRKEKTGKEKTGKENKQEGGEFAENKKMSRLEQNIFDTIVIPDAIKTPEFIEVWKLWIVSRTKQKKPVSWIALFQRHTERCLEWSKKYGIEAVINSLRNSIDNDYQGFFEPKHTRYGQHNSDNDEDRFGDIKESAADLVRDLAEQGVPNTLK